MMMRTTTVTIYLRMTSRDRPDTTVDVDVRVAFYVDQRLEHN
jgi:hypothetical protein